MKKIIVVLFLVFTLMGNQTAMGASITPVSKMGIITPNAYQLIYKGESKIANNYDGTINIAGTTSSYYAVDQLTLTLTLQQYVDGIWYSLSRYNYSNYNSSTLSASRTLGVEGGNYYRVFAQHSATDGTLNESGVTYSSEIYIQ